MKYQIVHRGGHVEVLDSSGNFVCSADTLSEAYRELMELAPEMSAK